MEEIYALHSSHHHRPLLLCISPSNNQEKSSFLTPDDFENDVCEEFLTSVIFCQKAEQQIFQNDGGTHFCVIINAQLKSIQYNQKIGLNPVQPLNIC